MKSKRKPKLKQAAAMVGYCYQKLTAFGLLDQQEPRFSYITCVQNYQTTQETMLICGVKQLW